MHNQLLKVFFYGKEEIKFKQKYTIFIRFTVKKATWEAAFMKLFIVFLSYSITIQIDNALLNIFLIFLIKLK